MTFPDSIMPINDILKNLWAGYEPRQHTNIFMTIFTIVGITKERAWTSILFLHIDVGSFHCVMKKNK